MFFTQINTFFAQIAPAYEGFLQMTSQVAPSLIELFGALMLVQEINLELATRCL